MGLFLFPNSRGHLNNGFLQKKQVQIHWVETSWNISVCLKMEYTSKMAILTEKLSTTYNQTDLGVYSVKPRSTPHTSHLHTSCLAILHLILYTFAHLAPRLASRHINLASTHLTSLTSFHALVDHHCPYQNGRKWWFFFFSPPLSDQSQIIRHVSRIYRHWIPVNFPFLWMGYSLWLFYIVRESGPFTMIFVDFQLTIAIFHSCVKEAEG